MYKVLSLQPLSNQSNSNRRSAAIVQVRPLNVASNERGGVAQGAGLPFQPCNNQKIDIFRKKSPEE
jgi:hypothetical protein